MDIERRSITLSLPADLLQQVERIAVSRRKSVADLLTELLTDLLNSEDEYGRARKRQLATLKTGFDLGTRGHAGWTRDELHER